MPSLRELLFGRKERVERAPRLTREQQSLLSNLITGGGIGQAPLYQAGAGLLQQILGGQDTGAAALEAPAMRQFQEEIVPEISERFAGMGGLRSGAFPQALGQAGASLAERLAGMRAQRQMGALGPAMQYAQAPGAQQMGLLGISPFETMVRPETGGLLGGLMPGLGGGAGMGLGMLPFMGGQRGAAAPEAAPGDMGGMLSTFMKIAPFL
jgi:hypothetical protein